MFRGFSQVLPPLASTYGVLLSRGELNAVGLEYNANGYNGAARLGSLPDPRSATDADLAGKQMDGPMVHTRLRWSVNAAGKLFCRLDDSCSSYYSTTIWLQVAQTEHVHTYLDEFEVWTRRQIKTLSRLVLWTSPADSEANAMPDVKLHPDVQVVLK
jgi:hypothetical protein